MAENSTTDSVNEIVAQNSTMNDFWSGLKEYIETDSRGVGIKAPVLYGGESKVKTTYLEIPTPAWYPDSLLRSIKRNNYLSMVNKSAILGGSSGEGTSLDFYKESSGDAISGLVKNAAKSIVSTVANQLISITNKVDSLLDGLVSLAGEDSSTVIKDVSNEPFLNSQPYMNIYGIHLTESFRDIMTSVTSAISIATAGITGKTFNKVIGLISDGDLKSAMNVCLGGISSDDALNVAGKTLKSVMSSKYAKEIGSDNILDIMKVMFQEETLRMHGVGETLLEATISGTYSMKCRVPYFGESASRAPIMSSYGNDGFSGLGNLQRSSGVFGEAIRNVTGFNTIWTNPIEWSPASTRLFTPARFGFDIFNDTIEHTILNLFFIWSFGATTKAVTDTMFVRPPYMYNIAVPGGFRYKYCICDFKVYPIGKLRKLSKVTDNNGNPVGNSDITKLFSNLFGGKDVNPLAVEYIPDAYHVSMEFTSKLPDLWNFMDTYLYNRDSDTVKLGDRIQTKLATLLNSFQNATKAS